MAAGSGEQTASQRQGFWKPRHAVIGAGVLLLVIFAVRSCGGDDEEKAAKLEMGDPPPRQAIAVQIPASQRPARVAPGAQQSYQPPVYDVPQPQPALPSADPGNPWAVRQQPAPNYGSRNVPQRSPTSGWGRQQTQRPQYSQPPGTARYRPLDEKPRASRESRSVPVAPAPVRPAAPYDRRSGSSFGNNGANPYAGGYPGYYGTTPYVGPGGYGGYGAGLPGNYGYGYPGIIGPGW